MNDYFTMSVLFLKCKLQLILSVATQGSEIAVSCILARLQEVQKVEIIKTFCKNSKDVGMA